MDRNRFKTKPSEDVVSPKPVARPVRQNGEISPPPPASHPARPAVSATEAATPQYRQAAQPQPAGQRPAVSQPPPAANKPVKRKIAVIAFSAALLTGVISLVLSHSGQGKTGLQNAAANASSGLHVSANGAAANSSAIVSGTVPFTPVVPKDKPQLAKLGSSAYNSQYKSYSFDDTFEGQKIRVSEQELPSGQASASGLIDKISASLKPQSVEPFTSPNGQPAYLLNATAQAGAQVVIFTAKDMMFFIQSSAVHDAASWIKYINNLQ